jgi:NADPH-dependent 2,4-dienoyl-CoA reductase/sulfur reductase-like enzyme
VDDIRICPACMSCSDQLATNNPITCAINPEAGRESELKIIPAARRKKVLVVGAGPAGMEAARVASLRGHEVVLCEKSDKMGGQLNYAAKPSHKKEFMGITTELIQNMKPDAVIIATGAEPAVPFTPGVDQSHVYSAIDVLSGRVSLQGATVLVGAGLVGLETALFLEEKKVFPLVITEPTDKLGGNVGLRTGLFARNSVTGSPTTVEEIKDGSVILQREGNFEELQVKNVVLAVGMRNNNDLVEELKAEGIVEELYLVGDCNLPRTLKESIEEGTIAGRNV